MMASRPDESAAAAAWDDAGPMDAEPADGEPTESSSSNGGLFSDVGVTLDIVTLESPVDDEPAVLSSESAATGPGGFGDDKGFGTTAASALESSPPRDVPAPKPFDLVDRIVQGLPWGHMVYNAPETMPYGETREIELLLSPTETAEQLQSQLRQPTDARSDNLQVGNRMEAVLTGTGFEIEDLSPPLQAVTSTRPTQWRWRIAPTRYGPQQLSLSLLAHIDVAGNSAPLVVETKDAVIQVEITLAQQVSGFVEANWKWLWATFVFPVVGYRLRRRRWNDHETGEPRRRAA